MAALRRSLAESQAEAALLRGLWLEWLEGTYDGSDLLRRVRMAVQWTASQAGAVTEKMMTDKEIFGTLKEEARHNVKRIDPMGEQLHANTIRLFVQPGLDLLAKEGVPDTRCGTCAFRTGTVPGGCLQTQADGLKAIMEGSEFMCHAHEVNGKHPTHCHGWIAARVAMDGATMRAPWPWVEDLSRAAREEALKEVGNG